MKKRFFSITLAILVILTTLGSCTVFAETGTADFSHDISSFTTKTTINATQCNSWNITKKWGTCLQMGSAGQYATYKINVTDAGAYDMSVKLSARQNVATTISVYIDDELRIDKFRFKQIEGTLYNLGVLKLAAGEHTMKVELSAGSLQLDEIYLEGANIIAGNKLDLGTSKRTSAVFNNYYQGDNSTSGDYISKEGLLNLTVAKGEVVYDVYVQEAGTYSISTYMGHTTGYKPGFKVTVDGEEVVSDIRTDATTGYYKAKKSVLGVFELLPGAHTIKLNVTAVGGYFFGISIENVNVEIDSVTAGDVVISTEGAVVPKGTPEFKINYTSQMKNAGTVELKSEAGDVIKTETDIEGTTVNVYVLKALAPNTPYILTVSGAQNIYDVTLVGEPSFPFTTNDEVGSLKDTIKFDKSTSQTDSNVDGKVKLSYYVETSAGKKIEGRTFNVTLNDPSGNPVAVSDGFSGLTDENGSFYVEYQFEQTHTSGEYTFNVNSECADSITTPITFTTDEVKEEILGQLGGIGDWEGFKGTFPGKASDIGIDLTTDLAELPDTDKFYAKLYDELKRAENSFESLTVFKNVYNETVIAETINQATTADVISDLFADEKLYERTSISKDTVKIVSTNNAPLADRVFTFSGQNLSNKELIDAVKNAINELILAAEGKDKLALTDATISINPGQSINIPVELSADALDVLEITVKVKSEDEFNQESAFVSVDEGEYATSWDENVLTVTFSYNRPTTLKSVGTISLAHSTDKSTYENVNVSVSVLYEKDPSLKEKYDLSEEIPLVDNIEKSYSVTVIPLPPQGGGSVGVGSTPTIKPSTVAPVVKPVEPEVVPDKPQVPEAKFEFTDIEDVSWAKDSINSLLEMGVISESESGCFNPNDNIKREEFVKLVIEALGLTDEESSTSLTDVESDAWYYKYIASAERNGIITGSDGKFNIGAYITRQDMSAIIKRALDLQKVRFPQSTGEVLFDDDGAISDYAKSAVYGLKSLNIINGTGDNKFTPKGNATRAQAAKMIYEMIKVVK